MFWLYEDELPPGVGGERFGAVHWAYLALFLTLTLGYAFFYKRLDAGRRRTADRVLGSAVFFFGLCEYGVTALIGRLGLYTLPLHLCSLMLVLTLLHAWTGGARPGSSAAKLRAFLGAVIFFPGIPGTWAALLFPDWMDYPFWHYLSLSGFMGHGLVSVYGASVIVADAEAADRSGLFRRDLKSSALFLGVGAALMAFFDRLTGANYWFMSGPSVGSPFEDVYERGGCRAYLLAYLSAAVLAAALWYGLRFFLFVRGKRRERAETGTDVPNRLRDH